MSEDHPVQYLAQNKAKLEQVAPSFVQMSFDYLQCWGLLSLPGQCISTQLITVFLSIISMGLILEQAAICVCCLSTFYWTCVRKVLTLSSLEILEVYFVSSSTPLKRHRALLILLWASHLITEGSQVGQAWFVPVNPILAAPYHLLFLQVLGGDFEEDLLQKLPSTWSYTDWPASPQILLLNPPEDGCDVCQSKGTFPDRQSFWRW